MRYAFLKVAGALQHPNVPMDRLLMGGIIINMLLLIALAIFVYLRFRRTSRLLRTFQNDWSSAQSEHQSLVDEARDRVENLASVPVAGRRNPAAMGRALLRSELRDHIVALNKKGFGAPDIARACSIPESDVNVLLGFARLHR